MKTNLLKKRVMGVVLGLSLLVGIGMASSNSVAQAQWQNRDWQREQLRRQREYEREQLRRQRELERRNRRNNNGRYDDGLIGDMVDPRSPDAWMHTPAWRP